MKTKILNLEGKGTKEIELPKVFSAKIRKDIVAKVLEARKTEQPYSPSPVAGKQHAAKGKLVHRRHVWRSGYGRGASRVPRKIFSRRGSQFNWEAAEVPQAKGGMRAHPPKILSRINTSKVNKKEMKIAFESALSATANPKEVSMKYATLAGKKIDGLPLIIEAGFVSAKAKDLIAGLKKGLGELFDVALPKKKVRSGRGKLRGRKYKKSAGLLIVLGDDEKIKTKIFDTKNARNLNVTDLAEGGLGRVTVYTENAIKDLKTRMKE
jgi:large subunit ribosomal protein L4e